MSDYRVPISILQYGAVPHDMVRLERMLDYRGSTVHNGYCCGLVYFKPKH